TDTASGNGARLDSGSLVLATMGRLAVRWSRPVVGTITTVTICDEADGWYASFSCSCAEVPTEPLHPTSKETASALRRQGLLVPAAQEAAVEHPRHYRRAELRLATAQRRLARRQTGSQRRQKARKVVAKHQQQVQRQRRDFPHTTARALLRQYDTLYVE